MKEGTIQIKRHKIAYDGDRENMGCMRDLHSAYMSFAHLCINTGGGKTFNKYIIYGQSLKQ